MLLLLLLLLLLCLQGLLVSVHERVACCSSFRSVRLLRLLLLLLLLELHALSCCFMRGSPGRVVTHRLAVIADGRLQLLLLLQHRCCGHGLVCCRSD